MITANSNEPPRHDDDLFTIVLAAGDGTRLRPLTRALHGEELPKQFATLLGDRSMLATTAQRASRWSRADHIVVVVARGFERLARSQLGPRSRVDVVTQPSNAGTGPGILLPLARVLAKEPRARVVVLPSDQYVADERTFAEAVRRADAAAVETDSVVLLGAVPDKAEEQYGWVVPRIEDQTGRHAVSSFREKPTPAVAQQLREAGALWSTFVMAAPAHTLWKLAEGTIPSHCARLDAYRAAVGTGRERALLERLYEGMAAADFSRDVLEKAGNLGVVPLPPCGWSDWGTPARVFESLRGTAHFSSLLAKLGSRAASFPELALGSDFTALQVA